MTPTIEASVVLKIGEQTIHISDAKAVKVLLQTLGAGSVTEPPKLDNPFYIKDGKVYKMTADAGRTNLYPHLTYLNQLRYALARIRGEKPPMGLNKIHFDEIMEVLAARHKTADSKYPYMSEQTSFRNTYTKYKYGSTIPKPLLILEYPALFGEFMAEVRRMEQDYENELYDLLTAA